METGLTVTTSNEINEIAKALAKAQIKIQGAEKDRTNPHFKSDYATLASVWDACHTALNENEIAIVQAPAITPDGGQIIVTILAHGSGQWFRGEYRVQAAKNDPQGVGSAVTYARRYSLSAMTGVAPRDDDDDGNAAVASHARQPQQQAQQQAPQTSQAGHSDMIDAETGSKVYTAFGALGVTREQLHAKLGVSHLAKLTKASLSQLGMWRDEITKDKRNAARIFGEPAASRADALNGPPPGTA